MVCLHIGDIPNITRVFAFGVSTKFAFLWTAIVAFSWVLLRYADCVKIEAIIIPFGKPENRLMTTTKSRLTVCAVPECPDNPVAQDEI